MRLFLCIFFIIPVFAEAKNVIVLGATSEIGMSIVQNLSIKTYNTFSAGRNANKLDKLSKISNTKTFIIDYKDVKTCQSLANKIDQEIQGIVVIPPRLEKVPNSKYIPSQKEWREILDMLFINPITCLKFLTDKLSNNASIILISGITSIDFIKGYENTNIVRQAIALETKNVITQLEDKKIRINTISLGYILTEATKKNINKNKLQIKEQDIPTPQDVSNLIIFLLSNDSKYINGQNIIINGRYFIKK